MLDGRLDIPRIEANFRGNGAATAYRENAVSAMQKQRTDRAVVWIVN